MARGVRLTVVAGAVRVIAAEAGVVVVVETVVVGTALAFGGYSDGKAYVVLRSKSRQGNR